MVDRNDDIKVGVKSTAILFGDLDLFVVGGLQMLMLVALIFIGGMAELSVWYYLSICVAALLMGYHQWLARDRQKSGCFAAFQHNHYIGMVVFIGIGLHYTFTPLPA
jgi:4-hydroxybenzoate polyprenyltransferase